MGIYIYLPVPKIGSNAIWGKFWATWSLGPICGKWCRQHKTVNLCINKWAGCENKSHPISNNEERHKDYDLRNSSHTESLSCAKQLPERNKRKLCEKRKK